MPSKVRQIANKNWQFRPLKLRGSEYPYRERPPQVFPETGGFFMVCILTILPENKTELNSQKHFR
jgi:hypothetical protein